MMFDIFTDLYGDTPLNRAADQAFTAMILDDMEEEDRFGQDPLLDLWPR